MCLCFLLLSLRTHNEHAAAALHERLEPPQVVTRRIMCGKRQPTESEEHPIQILFDVSYDCRIQSWSSAWGGDEHEAIAAQTMGKEKRATPTCMFAHTGLYLPQEDSLVPVSNIGAISNMYAVNNLSCLEWCLEARWYLVYTYFPDYSSYCFYPPTWLKVNSVGRRKWPGTNSIKPSGQAPNCFWIAAPDWFLSVSTAPLEFVLGNLGLKMVWSE